MLDLLNKGDSVGRLQVVEQLGNDVLAINSVCTALYCFLRALQPIKEMRVSNGKVDVFVTAYCTMPEMTFVLASFVIFKGFTLIISISYSS